jgi:hypothetical protein
MSDRARLLLGVLMFVVVIMLPLLLYLKRRAVSNRRIIPYFFLIYALWYLPYAPFHEACHFLAGRFTGLQAKSYRFLPRFWEGDFVNGYINWSGGQPWQIRFSCQAPYAIDGVLVLIGFLLFRKRNRFGPFLGALILTEVFLRSVFDVVVNYSAGTFGGAGDFYYLLTTSPPMAVHVGAWALILLGIGGALHEILKAQPSGLTQVTRRGELTSQ